MQLEEECKEECKVNGGKVETGVSSKCMGRGGEASMKETAASDSARGKRKDTGRVMSVRLQE